MGFLWKKGRVNWKPGKHRLKMDNEKIVSGHEGAASIQ